MRYEKLKRYRKLCREEAALIMKRRELEAKAERTADTVKGSLKEWPYTETTMKVEGLTEKGAAELGAEGAKIREALRRIRGEKEKIERYVSGVKDPVVEGLLRYHILMGMTWREASDKVFGFGRIREGTAMMIVLRYLGKGRY